MAVQVSFGVPAFDSLGYIPLGFLFSDEISPESWKVEQGEPSVR